MAELTISDIQSLLQPLTDRMESVEKILGCVDRKVSAQTQKLTDQIEHCNDHFDRLDATAEATTTDISRLEVLMARFDEIRTAEEAAEEAPVADRPDLHARVSGEDPPRRLTPKGIAIIIVAAGLAVALILAANAAPDGFFEAVLQAI